MQLKPENILVDPEDCMLKICDFGLAKSKENSDCEPGLSGTLLCFIFLARFRVAQSTQ